MNGSCGAADPNAPVAAVTSVLPQLTEERPDVADEQVRLLHRGEVPAPVELRPAHDVVGALGDVPQRDEVVLREDGERGGRRSTAARRSPQPSACARS